MKTAITSDVIISAVALACMALISFFALRDTGTTAASAPPYRAFIEERVEIDHANARISVPVVIGMGVEADERANRAISDALMLSDVLAFVKEKQEGASLDWDARMRFSAWRIGGVFRVSSVTTVYENGKMPNEARTEVYIDCLTGKRYYLADLFYADKLSYAIRAVAGEIERQMLADPKRFLDDALPYPLPDDFYFEDGRLVIYYQPGTIAPFSEGFIRFIVPGGVYADCLDKSGDFFTALTRTEG